MALPSRDLWAFNACEDAKMRPLAMVHRISMEFRLSENWILYIGLKNRDERQRAFLVLAD